MNSASACLTNNGDKYFIPFKPEGSRSTHFRLAYQPGDFDTAVKEYNKWLEQLIQQDWPVCFGHPREGNVSRHHRRMASHEQSSEPTNGNTRPDLQRAHSSPESSRKRGADHEGHDGPGQELGNTKKVKAENEQENHWDNTKGESSQGRVAHRMPRLDIKAATGYDGSTSCPPTPITLAAAAIEQRLSLKDSPITPRAPSHPFEDMELPHIPTSLADIVRVDVSTLPGAGNGLFAKMDLPVGTPLGFYFGVPMTENEFDSLKDGVGLASHYSIMYRRTVLDATDEQGQSFTDPKGPLYCPFHFMNEDSDGNVSFITGSIANQVVCTTNRDIQAGEELLVFYSREIDRHWSVPGQEATATTPTAAAAAAAPAAAAPTSGESGEASEEKKSRGGSRSSPSSPTRRTPVEEGGRPRRDTVYKPARYTR